jgi:hypothetical protein
MQNETPTPNADFGEAANSPVRADARRPPAEDPLPTIDQLLFQILQLNGALIMGALSPKEASLIQRNLKTVLDAQFKRAMREDAAPTQEGLVELCRKNPQAINTLASFLTGDQLQWLMGQIEDDADAPV